MPWVRLAAPRNTGLGSGPRRRRQPSYTPPVTLWQRWRADLARPEVPTGREGLGFLVGTAVVIVVAAQLTDPGTALDLILLSPAVVAFVLRGLVRDCPPRCSP